MLGKWLSIMLPLREIDTILGNLNKKYNTSWIGELTVIGRKLKTKEKKQGKSKTCKTSYLPSTKEQESVLLLKFRQPASELLQARQGQQKLSLAIIKDNGMFSRDKNQLRKQNLLLDHQLNREKQEV